MAEFNLDFSTRQATIILRQIPYHVQGIRLTSGTGMRRTKSERCAVAYMHASLSTFFSVCSVTYNKIMFKTPKGGSRTNEKGAKMGSGDGSP